MDNERKKETLQPDSGNNPESENISVSRRTALKYIGLGAAGAVGALYGIEKVILGEETAANVQEEGLKNASLTGENTSVAGLKNTSMKILLINGSPRREGNTFIALSEIATTLEAEGVKTSLVQLGSRAVQGCTACNKCYELGHCVFNDQLYAEIREKLAESDGLIVGFPVYFSGPNGSLCSLLDRIFYTSGDLLRYKVGAAIAVCRRSGASATLDRLNKYFTFSRMLLIGSQYWNAAHGREPGEVKEDKEGLQIMRTLARNMAWTIKNTKAAQQPFPEMEKRVSTDFIRK